MTSRQGGGRDGARAGGVVVLVVTWTAGLAAQAVARRARARARARVEAALRVSGVRALVSLYRHLAFDLPRLTTAAGVALLLGMAAIRLYLLASHVQPSYLSAWFALVGALGTAASVAMAGSRRPFLAGAGWVVGSVVALASLLVYLASRTVGLPGLSSGVGSWAHPLGTVAIIVSAAFLALHLSVLTGMNVAYPNRRQWHA